MLDDIEVQSLKETVKAMHGQQFGKGQTVDIYAPFAQGEQDVDKSFETVLEEYLDWQEWSKDTDPARILCIAQLMGAGCEQTLAAIRAWTGGHIHSVVTSVMLRATSRQCLEKILPYLRLLHESLFSLPPDCVASVV